jgi:hypothetical protein
VSFTEDLESLAQWLTQCGVEAVAMESTGCDAYRERHLQDMQLFVCKNKLQRLMCFVLLI